MTKEEKNLLFKDLCPRLPYGVKAYIKKWSKLDRKYYEGTYTIESVHPSLKDIYASTENGYVEVLLEYSDHFIKPYLFPLSSMTEEQKKELEDMGWSFDNFEINNINECLGTYREYVSHSNCFILTDWLNKNHFDYRGLIPMGLAKDATGLNIYINYEARR